MGAALVVLFYAFHRSGFLFVFEQVAQRQSTNWAGNVGAKTNETRDQIVGSDGRGSSRACFRPSSDNWS
jgi:hypothetical protein